MPAARPATAATHRPPSAGPGPRLTGAAVLLALLLADLLDDFLEDVVQVLFPERVVVVGEPLVEPDDRLGGEHPLEELLARPQRVGLGRPPARGGDEPAHHLGELPRLDDLVDFAVDLERDRALGLRLLDLVVTLRRGEHEVGIDDDLALDHLDLVDELVGRRRRLCLPPLGRRLARLGRCLAARLGRCVPHVSPRSWLQILRSRTG
jgi:hypothetical protein